MHKKKEQTKKNIIYIWEYHVPLQLKLSTGYREVHLQEVVSIQAPSLTLRCCEGEMEGMGEMGCLVPVGLKDKGESEDKMGSEE